MSRRRSGWDKHAIKAEIHRRGETLVGLARKAGLELSACKVALHRRNTAGEAAIAAFLDIDPCVLWPERFAARVVAASKATPGTPVVASPKRNAA